MGSHQPELLVTVPINTPSRITESAIANSAPGPATEDNTEIPTTPPSAMPAKNPNGVSHATVRFLQVTASTPTAIIASK
ncbi:unannotated protein [freshwater metagenome]|uniref:Unannotated protein n=1 Tax=freshwater metagenome TaxID=449393 RepID=A0A6J6BT46_9ZZZZ